MTKRSPSCGELLLASAFGRTKSFPDGLSFYCLACNRQRNNEWYRRRRTSRGKEVRDCSWVPEGFRWRPQCKQAVAPEDYTRNSRTASGFGGRCKACHNAYNSDAYLYRQYKLTQRQLEELRAAQGDSCAICGEPQPQHLDHDHDTGEIRQLLCQRCNQWLGLFRDEPTLLRAAADYVERHRARQAAASASSSPPEAVSRPGTPPVGSKRRPLGTRRTGLCSRGRELLAVREAGDVDEAGA
jgi:hypothetical protein